MDIVIYILFGLLLMLLMFSKWDVSDEDWKEYIENYRKEKE